MEKEEKGISLFCDSFSKNRKRFLVSFVFILVITLSITFVSAGWVSDVLGNIADNINKDQNVQFSPSTHEIISPRDGGAGTRSCNDLDGDGYGDPASVSCTYPDLDCNDDPANDPVGIVCPTSPADCTGVVYTGGGQNAPHMRCAICIWPGQTEICNDNIDNDCDVNTPDNCIPLANPVLGVGASSGASAVFVDVTVKPDRVIIIKEGGKYNLRVNGKRACVNYRSREYCAIQGESVFVHNVGEVKFEKVRSSKSLFRNKGAVKFKIISTSDEPEQKSIEHCNNKDDDCDGKRPGRLRFGTGELKSSVGSDVNIDDKPFRYGWRSIDSGRECYDTVNHVYVDASYCLARAAENPGLQTQ